MSVSDADIAVAADLFAPLGQITTRKMFGGMCLYQDGTVFALLSSDGTLHLKAPGDIATELAALGGSQFHSMPYWTLPDAALDDPDIALDWARRALSSL